MSDAGRMNFFTRRSLDQSRPRSWQWIAVGMATLGDSASENIAAAITNAGRDIGEGIGKIGEGIGHAGRNIGLGVALAALVYGKHFLQRLQT